MFHKRLAIPLGLAACLAVLLASSPASAQLLQPDNARGGIDPEDAVVPISIVEGPGVKVGEGTVLHPIFGVETGVISNVFFTDANAVGAGLLRLFAEVGAGSLSPQRMQLNAEDSPASPPNRGDFEYRADVHLSYDFMLSGNDRVTQQNGLGGGGLFRGIANPGRTWQFGFYEDFNRMIRPTNFESSKNIDRDINRLRLQLMFVPLGRNLSASLRYENTLDLFESDHQQFANRFQQTFGLRVNYNLFPKTRTYIDVSQGVFSGIGDSQKVESYPLTALAGIQTYLGVSSTLVGRIGYANGFYSAGPSFSSVTGGIDFGYRYSPFGRFTVTYNYEHQDSVNANYYRDHIIRGTLDQIFVPFELLIQPELHFREYDGISLVMGPPTRDDVIGAVNTEIRYNFRDWLATVLDYSFTQVQTDYRYTTDGMVTNPSYVRHELLLGVRAAL